MLYILQTIICYTFDDFIGRMQWKRQQDGEPMYGMEITFRLHETDYDREARYPGVQLLIFAESNYVGVYYRESETRDEYEPWKHLSRHDSCWKGDGVDRFLHLFEERIAGLGWNGGICNNKWYLKREISKQEAEGLRETTRQRHAKK